MGDQEIEYELPDGIFKSATDEKPHIHKSKPHPSKNEKQCDLCSKRMIKHYHVCEDCWKFMKASFITKMRDLEKRIKELEK